LFSSAAKTGALDLGSELITKIHSWFFSFVRHWLLSFIL